MFGVDQFGEVDDFVGMYYQVVGFNFVVIGQIFDLQVWLVVGNVLFFIEEIVEWLIDYYVYQFWCVEFVVYQVVDILFIVQDVDLVGEFIYFCYVVVDIDDCYFFIVQVQDEFEQVLGFL